MRRQLCGGTAMKVTLASGGEKRRIQFVAETPQDEAELRKIYKAYMNKSFISANEGFPQVYSRNGIEALTLSIVTKPQ